MDQKKTSAVVVGIAAASEAARVGTEAHMRAQRALAAPYDPATVQELDYGALARGLDEQRQLTRELFWSGPIPDRLSVEPDSPHFNRDVANGIRVWFKGVERKNVVEYCISERWVRFQCRDGKQRPLWRKGKHVTTPKLQGDIKVEWRNAQTG